MTREGKDIQAVLINLGERIRKKRCGRRLSQEEFAYMVNMSPGHLSHIENGKSNMKLSLFITIAAELGESADEFLIDCFQKTGPDEEQSDNNQGCNKRHVLDNESTINNIFGDCNETESDIIIRIMEESKKIIREFKK